MDYPTRRWALTSLVEWAGKTTFLAANIASPAYVIDGDSRWGLVKHLVEGNVQFAAGAIILDPLALMEAVQRVMEKGVTKALCCDPITKLYSHHSRRASMAGRLSIQERENRGYGKNVAKLHVGKADTIEIITNLAMYGVDTYYTWHKREGVDAKGTKGIRDRISEVELNTLRQSIDVEIEFVKEVNPVWQKGEKNAQNFLYGATVKSARGLAGKPVSTGFTVWDTPNNFWNGGADRIERLIYTSFRDPKEAILWASQRFEGAPPLDLKAEYEKKKKVWNPDVAGQMYSQWIEYVDDLVKDPEAAKKPDKKQPEPDIELKYKGGKPVAEKDVADFHIYQNSFGQVPYDFKTMDRAKQMNIEKGTWE